MSLNVLSTALQYQAPTIFVVMNYSALGWVRDDRLDRPEIAEYIPTDFAAIARGFGCQGFASKSPRNRIGDRPGQDGRRADGDRRDGEPR